MQLGLSTYSFPWAVGVSGYMPATPLTAVDLLHYAAAHHIGYVQFGDNMPLHTFSEPELSSLKETADTLHMSIEVGTRRLTVENISNYLLIAQQFNSPFVRVVIDDEDYHPNEQQVIEIIRALMPQLKETGICLAIENHDRFPALTLQRIIQQTDPMLVGICLDTANSLGANEGTTEVVKLLAPYTVNLHVKDITIQRLPHKMGFLVEGCAAGDGIVNVPAIIKQLKPYNKCRSITLEVWSSPGASIEETLLKEKQLVEKSIHYLKKILS